MERSPFDRVRIGPLTLPNRFVRSATWEGMCDGSGNPTPRLADLYRDLVRGGLGLIITGYAVVHPKGRQMPGSMGAYSDRQIPALTELTSRVRDDGGKLFAQLVHAGAQTNSRVIGEQPMAPSAVTTPFCSGVPREMSVAEIKEAVASFGQAARRIRESGFQGVQFHGAHGYLINQFLSPLTNRRRDDYGGSRAGRFRFLEEVFLAARSEVGDDYPLIIKLSATDHLEGGLGIDDAIWYARRLEELGIDAVEVSAGTAGSGDRVPVRKGISRPDKEAYNAEYARLVRASVSIPVILVGGLRTLGVIEGLLRDGAADLFALSRPLIREPGLVDLWKKDPDHRATCISCNKCFRPGLREGGIYCVIDRMQEERDRQMSKGKP